jgi:hypothetical protein
MVLRLAGNGLVLISSESARAQLCIKRTGAM